MSSYRYFCTLCQAIRQAQERKKDGPDARLGLLFLSKRNTEAEDPAKVQVS